MASFDPETDTFDINDSDSVVYVVGGTNPLKTEDRINVQFHCHRSTLTEAIAACFQFIDSHDLETPDIHTEHQGFENPHNGISMEWYEATVAATLPAQSRINIQQTPGA